MGTTFCSAHFLSWVLGTGSATSLDSSNNLFPKGLLVAEAPGHTHEAARRRWQPEAGRPKEGGSDDGACETAAAVESDLIG